jgi:phospholipid/cholesterol/gamma-HCH transport system ATP-binding protein
VRGTVALREGTSAMSDTAATSPVIVFHDVHIGFGGKEVLRGLSFSLVRGETKVLLGESGSGKTVLLKLAAGLIRPDAGDIAVMGHDLNQMSETELLAFRAHIGFVFQEGALFDSLTVRENVAFRLHEEHTAEEETEERVREALRFVEMEDFLDKFPPELSGGMRRRVSIARALVSRPDVVFYDSPTAGLDPVTAQTIISLLIRLRDLQGVTSVMATHRLQDLFGLANYRFDPGKGHVVNAGSNGAKVAMPVTHALFLRDGVSAFEGDALAVMNSKDPYLERFLASAR